MKTPGGSIILRVTPADTTLPRSMDRVSQSFSTSAREVPVLEPARLRQLPFGQAILLLRAAAPILLDLQPWTKRKDAKRLRVDQGVVEALIRAGHGH